jgi:cytoskeletal protein CcmA (bactofilin family)
MPETALPGALVEPETALIAPGAEFEGLLVLRGPARIEGHVRGEIHGSSLWIGRSAAVDAHLEVEQLVVSGELAGSVRARGRIQLRPTARVSASLESANLVLEDGCRVNGPCSMGPRRASDTA